VIKKLLKIKF